MPLPVAGVEAILGAARRMDARGWVPATAGNLSVRIDTAKVAITASGTHKGRLTASDVIEVDLDGTPADPRRVPSAETRLHCQIYAADPEAGAVLHGHSVAATVLSMAAGEAIGFAGYEVLKAFERQTRHDVALDLPVFDNDQDMRRLASVIAPHLAGAKIGYLLRGHGVYVWGGGMDQAMARLEALEFLLACELERRKLR